ncbi:MAG: serine/threonine-protein kinase [Thermoanaerobaculia bacterium]
MTATGPEDRAGGVPPAEATDVGEFLREGPAETDGAEHPRRIGRYRVLEVLGQGGMGTVYLAEQTEPIRRRVAIKLIRSSRRDTKFTHRFEAERQAVARMSHPCIAQVYEAGDTDQGQPFFAMEHVPGVPITEYCRRERLSLEERLDLVVAVCRGIQHAHQKGVLHRDIKPGNILVATEQGRPSPKIIDFGVAKDLEATPGGEGRTVFGEIVGTPSYLSPEAIAGTTESENADPDTRADVYALGVLLFELLTGDRPFGRSGESVVQILRQVTEEDVPAPSARFRSLDEESRNEQAVACRTTPVALLRRLRGDLDWITLKATARQRDARYDSAAALADEIERFRRFEPVAAGPPRRLYVIGKFVRRYRAAVVAAVLVVLALVGGVTARTLEARRANREAAAARQAQRETQEVVDFMVDLFEVNDPGTTRGNTITAREILDRGAEEIRARLGTQPLSRARLLDTIGQVYRQLDLPEPAAPLLEEALAIREKELGPGHPEVASSLDHLGDLQWIRGDYPAAEAILRKALAIREKEADRDGLAVAEVLDHLGSVYEVQAKYDEARPLLERALAIREKELGPETLPVASSLDDLGVLHLDRGEFEAAEPYFRRALAIRTKLLGPDHPEVAVTANGLAGVLYGEGRIEESLAFHEQALAVREKVFGAESSPVAQTLNNMSNLYLDLGRTDEGERALLRAKTIWEKVLGPDHPRLGIVLFNLADLYDDRGEWKRAETLYRRAAGIWEAALGSSHPRLAYALLGLAESLRAQGRAADGLPLCRRALAIREAALPADSPELAQTRAACAGWPGS